MRGWYAVMLANPPAPIECLQLPALVHSEHVGRIAAIKTEDLRRLSPCLRRSLYPVLGHSRAGCEQCQQKRVKKNRRDTHFQREFHSRRMLALAERGCPARARAARQLA